jgi:hypothetical protein
MRVKGLLEGLIERPNDVAPSTTEVIADLDLLAGCGEGTSADRLTEEGERVKGVVSTAKCKATTTKQERYSFLDDLKRRLRNGAIPAGERAAIIARLEKVPKYPLAGLISQVTGDKMGGATGSSKDAVLKKAVELLSSGGGGTLTRQDRERYDFIDGVKGKLISGEMITLEELEKWGESLKKLNGNVLFSLYDELTGGPQNASQGKQREALYDHAAGKTVGA